MAPSYLKICKKVLQQKQLADKRNDLLYKKINMLERNVIELEALKIKCENLTRDNFYLELELKELKQSQDAMFVTSLENKSKMELTNQILTLLSQVSALEKTNMELWIDKRKLSRKLDALKPSPLSVICGSKEFVTEPKDLADNDNLSSILGNEYNWTNDSVDDSFIVDHALKLLEEVEKKVPKPIAMESLSRFQTPVKRRYSSTRLSNATNWLSTPPIAVIPPWCVGTAEEDTLPRSMVVSTVFSDHFDPELSAIELNQSFSTATTYRKIEICRPKSMPALSSTLKQIDYENIPETAIDNSVDKNSVHLSISDEEEDIPNVY